MDLQSMVASHYARRERCPCCGEGAGRTERAIASSPPAESLAMEEHGRFRSGYSAARIFFTYHRCGACGLLYCPVYYSAGQLKHLYGHQDENMSEVPMSARMRTQEHYAKLASPATLPDGDFLELGSDIGLFAQLCAAQKHFGHLWLYEPNKDVRAELDSRLAQFPHTVVETPFALTDVRAGSVALAAAVHVLDHVWEPLEVLKGLYEALAPCGRLLLVTHDERSLLARVFGRRWPPYTLQHPQLYSAASLNAIAVRAGFQQVNTVKTVNYFPLFHLARAAFQVLNLPARMLPTWQGAQLGLRLGNVAAIATKLF
jgi:SAM-dependent methyltransferase